MTAKNPPQLPRRAVRAQLRQGPPWTLGDLIITVPVVLGAVLMMLAPGLLADIGDTVIGPTRLIPELGASLSGILLAGMRVVLVLCVLYILLAGREAPWVQRTAWAWLALGIMMNYSKAVYAATPATVAFFIIQVALMVLLYRLSMRPTIWERLAVQEDKTKAALDMIAEKDLRIEQSESETLMWRRKYETAEKLLGRNP